MPLSKEEEFLLTAIIIELADGSKVTDEDVLRKLITLVKENRELKVENRELRKDNYKLKKLVEKDNDIYEKYTFSF